MDDHKVRKLNHILRLLSLTLVVVLLNGCIKPCQVDWAHKCPEASLKQYEVDLQMSELQNEKLKENIAAGKYTPEEETKVRARIETNEKEFKVLRERIRSEK